METLRDLFRFLMERKKYWLLPVVLVLLLLSALLFLAEGSAISTFVYTLF
jgi:hypothetical protein